MMPIAWDFSKLLINTIRGPINDFIYKNNVE